MARSNCWAAEDGWVREALHTPIPVEQDAIDGLGADPAIAEGHGPVNSRREGVPS